MANGPRASYRRGSTATTSERIGKAFSIALVATADLSCPRPARWAIVLVVRCRARQFHRKPCTALGLRRCQLVDGISVGFSGGHDLPTPSGLEQPLAAARPQGDFRARRMRAISSRRCAVVARDARGHALPLSPGPCDQQMLIRAASTCGHAYRHHLDLEASRQACRRCIRHRARRPYRFSKPSVGADPLSERQLSTPRESARVRARGDLHHGPGLYRLVWSRTRRGRACPGGRAIGVNLRDELRPFEFERRSSALTALLSFRRLGRPADNFPPRLDRASASFSAFPLPYSPTPHDHANFLRNPRQRRDRPRRMYLRRRRATRTAAPQDVQFRGSKSAAINAALRCCRASSSH